MVSGFSKLLGSQKDENWPLPTMYAVCLDLRLLALKADQQKSKGGKGKPGETLEKASEGIMSCFRWELTPLLLAILRIVKLKQFILVLHKRELFHKGCALQTPGPARRSQRGKKMPSSP